MLFSTDAKVKDFAEVSGQNPDPKRLLQSSTLVDLFWQLEKSPMEALRVRLWWEAVQVQGGIGARRRQKPAR